MSFDGEFEDSKPPTLRTHKQLEDTTFVVALRDLNPVAKGLWKRALSCFVIVMQHFANYWSCLFHRACMTLPICRFQTAKQFSHFPMPLSRQNENCGGLGGGTV